MPGTAFRNAVSVSWPSARMSESASSVSNSPGRLREALLVELHHFDREGRAVDLLDGAQPVDLHALFDRLVGLEVVRRHLLAGAPVDDERIGAEPPGGARRIHRGVAAAVDRDAAADLRRVAADLDVLEKLQRVVDRPASRAGMS